MNDTVAIESIENRIFLIRGEKVMIDRDLAKLYGVETKHLNRQVKRNIKRFPPEFMFQLTQKEKNELVTNWHRFKSMKHSTIMPYTFTEHGAVMLASVLKSERAIKMSVLIVKTFIELRRIVSQHKELLQRINEIEKKVQANEIEIKVVFDAIRKLMIKEEKPKAKIGFVK